MPSLNTPYKVSIIYIFNNKLWYSGHQQHYRHELFARWQWQWLITPHQTWIPKNYMYICLCIIPLFFFNLCSVEIIAYYLLIVCNNSSIWCFQVEKMKDEQRKILGDLEMTRKRSRPLPRPNTVGAPEGHQVRTKPKLHRSVNLGPSRCGC